MGCPGLGRGSLGWSYLLPTPHPTVSHCMARGLETACAHVLAHTCAGTAHGWVVAGVQVAHARREALEGPLAASPPQCVAKPCRIQLSIRNKSFYSWKCGSIPVSVWFGVVGSRLRGCGGAQGWGASLLPRLPSHALGDAPAWVSSSSPGAALPAWWSRAEHWLGVRGASALHHDLQFGQGRCQPDVNAVVPGQDRDLWGSWEEGKGWGCCKSPPCTGTPSSESHQWVLQPFSRDGGRQAPLSPVPPAQGDISQAGSPGGCCAPHQSHPGPGPGAVPGQEGRELGRAGRGAPAGKGSGASCGARHGLQQPTVGRATGPSSAQSLPQYGSGMRTG